MSRILILFSCALLFIYFNISCERSDDVEIEYISKIEYVDVPVVITKKDTIFIHVQKHPKIEEMFIDSLKVHLGLREATGKNDGPAVAAILASCGINIPAPWCACFLHDGLIRLGTPGGPKVHPGLSSQWFRDGARVTWVRDRDHISTYFEKGWIGGIWFRSKGRIAHVFAIIEDTRDGYVITIEGNTNSAGAREGDGVFIRVRHKNEIYMVADWTTQYKDLVEQKN